MLTVVCVKVGNRYGAEYVEKLARGVSTWLEGDDLYRFVCVTEDAHSLPTETEIVSPIDGLPGWWQKMGLCKPEPWGIEGLSRILYLDLDVVVTDWLAEIIDYPTDFAMHHDFQRPWRCASAVMVLDAGSRSWIWDHFWANRAEIMRRYHGDQEYLYDLQQNLCRFRPHTPPKPHCDLFPQRWVRSYKMHCQDGPPEDCRIVAFHGKPDPHECGGWVKERW